MAYTTINKSSDHFNTVLYTGNETARTITVGFQPDWVWTKCRNDAHHHILTDSVTGAGKRQNSNTTNTQDTTGASVASFVATGYTLTDNSTINGNSDTNVSWNWKGGGSASSNSNGSITSNVSANTTSGFSIVTYTGTSSNATIGHGLGVAPNMIIVKNLTDARSWAVYHSSLGATKGIDLDGTGASGTASTYWYNTEPTTTVFSIGTANNTGSSHNFVAFCFAEKKGYSKFGSYIGNGNADGTFIYTGFKPAFVLLKKATGSAGDWYMHDNKRDVDNPVDISLSANSNNTDNTQTNILDLISNGFKIRTTGSGYNNDNSTYIYMAFAEAPLVGSNNIPCTAR